MEVLQGETLMSFHQLQQAARSLVCFLEIAWTRETAIHDMQTAEVEPC